MKNSKKILYVHNSSFDSQIANSNQVASMCNEFSNFLDIKLLSFGFDEKKIRKFYGFKKKVNLVLIKSKMNYYFRSFYLYLKFFKISKEIDYIYTRDLIVAFLISKFHKNIKVIYELHEIIEKKTWKILFKLTFKNLHNLIVISNGLKSEISKFRFDKNKITVLHDGVNLDLYKIKTSKKELKKKFKFPKKKIIFYAGGFQNWKGVDTFLEASKYCSEKVKFVIAGGNKEKIIFLKKKYKSILFLGKTTYLNLPKYLKASDILILPNSGKFKISTIYTSPLKLFSYLASKRLIISSNLPSIKEVVSNKEVIFFKPDDFKDLAKKINFIIAKGFKPNLIINSYKLAKKYSWKNRAKIIVDLFEK